VKRATFSASYELGGSVLDIRLTDLRRQSSNTPDAITPAWQKNEKGALPFDFQAITVVKALHFHLKSL
jgi:hypothetical protein